VIEEEGKTSKAMRLLGTTQGAIIIIASRIKYLNLTVEFIEEGA
jgi:hypothetical protein